MLGTVGPEDPAVSMTDEGQSSWSSCGLVHFYGTYS